jgi:hypothetical protein
VSTKENSNDKRASVISISNLNVHAGFVKAEGEIVQIEQKYIQRQLIAENINTRLAHTETREKFRIPETVSTKHVYGGTMLT